MKIRVLLISFVAGFAFNFGIFAASWYLQALGFYQLFTAVHDVKFPSTHYIYNSTKEEDTVYTPAGSTFKYP